MNSTIFVGIKTSFTGFHRWKSAPEEVKFLRDFHRHVFYVVVEMEVQGFDRSIEYFIAQKAIENYISHYYLDRYFDSSCETLASEIGNFCMDTWKDEIKSCTVIVSEDDENYGKVIKRRNTDEL
jgi:hypothetical protein